MRRLVGQRGFTLVELMITIAIAAILIAVAVPSFQTLSLNSRQTNAINQFAAMIGRGRSEAVSRAKSPIVACASTDSRNAAPSCSGNNNWQAGWILFADLNSNYQFNAGDVLLQIGEALPVGVTVSDSGFSATAGAGRIVFVPGTGLLLDEAAGGLVYCDNRGFTNVRALSVGPSGQVRIATDSDNNGFLEDGAGTAVVAC